MVRLGSVSFSRLSSRNQGKFPGEYVPGENFLHPSSPTQCFYVLVANFVRRYLLAEESLSS